ncbi:MAG: cytochrome c family protein [Halioglobus sp.]|nr:cytochrome c family protein [Halioglobus sp.]
MSALVAAVLVAGVLALNAAAEESTIHRMDPTKTIGSDECVDCHEPEHGVWENTTHFKTYDELPASDRATEITDALDIYDIEAPDGLCVGCHYTLVGETVEDALPIAGISCESCHGEAADWVEGHGNYAGGSIDAESEAQKQARIKAAADAGQIRPAQIHLIARNCLACHTVPNEKLVNVGGHLAGSDFELVSWSQGEVRHNLFWSGGEENRQLTPERKRLLYVVGYATDAEFSLRGLGLSTEAGDYRTAMTKRVKNAVAKLEEIGGKVQSPQVKAIVSAASSVNVDAPNSAQLVAAADKISGQISAFLKANDGAALAGIDPLLPSGDGHYSEKYP